jgi:hypothetical protein
LGQVPILTLDLSQIRPSPENDRLYRPISPDDPDIIALAESIEREGLLEPFILTADHYIISGHRRFAACQRLCRQTVRCQIRQDVYYGTTEFVRLLREANRQRVKSLDEVVREEIISANPEEAHRALVEHRRKKAEVSAETITLKDTRQRAQITKAKAPFLEAIRRVLEERRDYWPLTDRQIHYALLNDPPLIHASKPGSTYTNTQKSYKALCELLTRARLEGYISFYAIDDPTRPVESWDVWPGAGPFVRKQLDDFLKGYYRDLQRTQPNQIEIIGEKNTIINIIAPVASEFCIPYTIGRGYCSIRPRHTKARRFEASGKEKLVLLVLSDFDPEGEDIAESYARSMRDDFGIESIVPIKVALTKDQVQDMGLPPQMKAKEGSSRRKGFVEKYGDDVFELEAVPPDQLQEILREAIDGVLDVDAFNAEVDAEKQDAAGLDRIRRQFAAHIDVIQKIEFPAAGDDHAD